jgi:hypothetical protein
MDFAVRGAFQINACIVAALSAETLDEQDYLRRIVKTFVTVPFHVIDRIQPFVVTFILWGVHEEAQLG